MRHSLPPRIMSDPLLPRPRTPILPGSCSPSPVGCQSFPTPVDPANLVSELQRKILALEAQLSTTAGSFAPWTQDMVLRTAGKLFSSSEDPSLPRQAYLERRALAMDLYNFAACIPLSMPPPYDRLECQMYLVRRVEKVLGVRLDDRTNLHGELVGLVPGLPPASQVVRMQQPAAGNGRRRRRRGGRSRSAKKSPTR